MGGIIPGQKVNCWWGGEGAWLQRLIDDLTWMEAIPEYKIILLGEPGVGKTNFFFRLRDGVFIGSTASTVSTGIEHMEYKMRINGSTIKVSIERSCCSINRHL